jgi:hypothetical protein
VFGGGRYFSGGGVCFFVVVSGSKTLITGIDCSILILGAGGGGAGLVVVGRGVVGRGVVLAEGVGGGGVGRITGGGIGFCSAGIIILPSSPRQPSGKKYRIFSLLSLSSLKFPMNVASLYIN